jgi:hypothetical protein
VGQGGRSSLCAALPARREIFRNHQIIPPGSPGVSRSWALLLQLVRVAVFPAGGGGAGVAPAGPGQRPQVASSAGSEARRFSRGAIIGRVVGTVRPGLFRESVEWHSADGLSAPPPWMSDGDARRARPNGWKRPRVWRAGPPGAGASSTCRSGASRSTEPGPAQPHLPAAFPTESP